MVEASPRAIVGGTTLVGAALEPVVDSVVVVEDGVVRAAGPAGTVDVPQGAIVEDASGSLIAPGFIDAHVHIGFFAPAAIVARGVTTVRDLGWPPATIFELARRSRHDGFDGPAILAAGGILTAPGGYPTRAPWAPEGTGIEITADGAHDAVVATQRAGAAVVKVALNPPAGPVMDRSCLEEVVRAAHGLALRVTAHVHGLAELEKALTAGVDELAHMLLSPETIPDELLDLMVDRGTTVVPTLSIFFGRARRVAVRNLRRFLERGGRTIYGTDLGNEGPRPGIDAREVAGLLAAGMSPRAIVASATVESAAYLGLAGTGTIAAGAPADLVALPESALGGGRELSRVRRTWRRGRPAGRA